MFILKKGHQPGVYVPLRALFIVLIVLLYIVEAKKGCKKKSLNILSLAAYLLNSGKPFEKNYEQCRPTSCFDTPARRSPTVRPLLVIAILPILCFSGQHLSEPNMHHFYFFQFAPARFPRAVLLFSYRPQ